jgi:hypothetical protein
MQNAGLQLTPQQKLQQQILSNQQQMLLQQKHLQHQQQLKQYQQMQQQMHSGEPAWAVASPRDGNGNVGSAMTSVHGGTVHGGGSGGSGGSNDSIALESRTTKPLFSDDLVVIERSNRELELKLTPQKPQDPHTLRQIPDPYHSGHRQQEPLQSKESKPSTPSQPPAAKDVRNVKNEDSPSTGKVVKNLRFNLPVSQKPRSAVVDTIHNNNGLGYADVIYEEFSHADELERIKSKISVRPLSECYSASQVSILSTFFFRKIFSDNFISKIWGTSFHRNRQI